jgi:hypothetical protein
MNISFAKCISIAMGWIWLFRLCFAMGISIAMGISPCYVYFDCYGLAIGISIVLCYGLAMGISLAMCWLWVVRLLWAGYEFRLLWAGYGFFDCALLWVFQLL